MPPITTLLNDLAEAGQVFVRSHQSGWSSSLEAPDSAVYRAQGDTLEKCIRRLWLRVWGEDQEIPA